MPKIPIIPPQARAAAQAARMSPGILSGDHLFLTGMTGGDADGTMPEDPETQMRSAFAKIGGVLAEVGLGFDAIVEMTTYHVGLRDHFDLFDAIRLETLPDPQPAWTAIEAGGLRREGAVIEIRAIATTTP